MAYSYVMPSISGSTTLKTVKNTVQFFPYFIVMISFSLAKKVSIIVHDKLLKNLTQKLQECTQ